mmetsp:Transcript_35577/g.99462  ORF Transcript_35577/g.99462 Transcript_35577/m.99462 type:complete len:94 (-) Transcript_35577:4-285(-)
MLAQGAVCNGWLASASNGDGPIKAGGGESRVTRAESAMDAAGLGDPLSMCGARGKSPPMGMLCAERVAKTTGWAGCAGAQPARCTCGGMGRNA